MARLINELTWSHSRQQLFDACRRAYWYHYYASWRGWGFDAGREAQRAYRLKQIRGRWAWVGNAVHSAIEEVLGRLRRGESPEQPGAVRTRMRQAMRRQWASSAAGRWWRDPKRIVRLLEHHYPHLAVTDEAWVETWEHAAACLDAFWRHPLWEELRGLDGDAWAAIEELDSMKVAGHKVWVVPDLAFWRGEARDALVLVDWKTSRSGQGPNPVQLGCYSLYAVRRWGISPDRIEAFEVHLGASGAVRPVEVGAELLERTEAFIAQGLEAMREPLDDPKRNVGREQAFPPTDDTSTCWRCRFLEMCRPDLLAEWTQAAASRGTAGPPAGNSPDA